MLAAGKLRHPVTLLAPTANRNEVGEEIPAWSPVAEVWAEAIALSGRELVWAQQQHEQVTWRVTIRYLEQVDSTWRVMLASGQVLEIAGVTHDMETLESTTLYCLESR